MNGTINSIYSVRTVSGSEHGFLSFIRAQLCDCCDEIFADSIGNVYAVKKGNGAQPKHTVAIVCAVDEPGFVVTYIEQNGKIRLHGIGASDWGSFVKSSAESANGTSGILLSEESDSSKISADDLYLDVGAESADDVTLAEGDFVYVKNPPAAFGKNKYCLGVMGEKAFASAIIDIAKCAGDYCFDLCFVFASQHLLGGRGVKCAAYTAKADTVIAFTSVSSEKSVAGGGALICTADSGGKCSRTLCAELCDAANGIGVKYAKYADVCKEKPSFTAPFLAQNAKVAIIAAAFEKNDCGANVCDVRDIRSAAAIDAAYLIFRDEKEET